MASSLKRSEISTRIEARPATKGLFGLFQSFSSDQPKRQLRVDVTFDQNHIPRLDVLELKEIFSEQASAEPEASVKADAEPSASSTTVQPTSTAEETLPVAHQRTKE